MCIEKKLSSEWKKSCRVPVADIINDIRPASEGVFFSLTCGLKRDRDTKSERDSSWGVRFKAAHFSHLFYNNDAL